MPANKKGNSTIPPKEAIESAVGSDVSITALDIGIKDERGIETIVFDSARRDIPKEVLSTQLAEGMTIKAENDEKGLEHAE